MESPEKPAGHGDQIGVIVEVLAMTGSSVLQQFSEALSRAVFSLALIALVLTLLSRWRRWLAFLADARRRRKMVPLVLMGVSAVVFIIASLWLQAPPKLSKAEVIASSVPGPVVVVPSKEETMLSGVEENARNFIAPNKGGPLLPYYVRDIRGFQRMSTSVIAPSGSKMIVTIYYDLPHNGYFVSLYIPPQEHAADGINMADEFAIHYKATLKEIKALPFTLSIASPVGGSYDTQKITYTGRLFIYFDDFISNEDAARLTLLYADHGVSIEIRSRSWIEMKK